MDRESKLKISLNNKKTAKNLFGKLTEASLAFLISYRDQHTWKEFWMEHIQKWLKKNYRELLRMKFLRLGQNWPMPLFFLKSCPSTIEISEINN